jgi:hypothetical protein
VAILPASSCWSATAAVIPYTVSRREVWTSTQTSRSFPAEDLLPESRVAQDNKRMARKTSEEMDRQLHAGIEQAKAAMLRRVN